MNFGVEAAIEMWMLPFRPHGGGHQKSEAAECGAGLLRRRRPEGEASVSSAENLF